VLSEKPTSETNGERASFSEPLSSRVGASEQPSLLPSLLVVS